MIKPQLIDNQLRFYFKSNQIHDGTESAGIYDCKSSCFIKFSIVLSENTIIIAGLI